MAGRALSIRVYPSFCPSVLLSFCPSVLPSASFLRIGSLVFSGTQCGVGGPCVVVSGRAKFFEKNIFAQKVGQKWAKNRFLNLLENLVINFFLNLGYNESLYYLLYSCTNSIFGKNLFPEMWAKMLLANQITGF